MAAALLLVRQGFAVCAAAIAAYDPSVDTNDAAAAAGSKFILKLLDEPP